MRSEKFSFNSQALVWGQNGHTASWQVVQNRVLRSLSLTFAAVPSGSSGSAVFQFRGNVFVGAFCVASAIYLQPFTYVHVALFLASAARNDQ